MNPTATNYYYKWKIRYEDYPIMELQDINYY